MEIIEYEKGGKKIIIQGIQKNIFINEERRLLIEKSMRLNSTIVQNWSEVNWIEVKWSEVNRIE